MEDANTIISELQARNLSHPTVSTIWLLTLEKSIGQLEKDLADARQALEAMHTEPDITLEQLTTIYTVFGRGR